MLALSAFSLNMLPQGREIKITIFPVTIVDRKVYRITLTGEQFACFTEELQPGIGHKDTAAVVEMEFDITVPLFNRATVKLNPGNEVLVFQYFGPRLEEGSTSLPHGARIEPVIVRVENQ